MRLHVLAAAFLSLSAAAIAGQAAYAAELDTNGDGTVSLDEAHAAASRKFDALDSAHSGKLTAQQLSPVSKAMAEMATHDKDQSIDKTEYMAGVDAAFKEADPSGSGKLNAAALKTPAGERFKSLVE